MPAQTSMLYVRVDDQLKAQASSALAGVGPTLSDAVRILLIRVAAEGGLPAGLAPTQTLMRPGFGPRRRMISALLSPIPGDARGANAD